MKLKKLREYSDKLLRGRLSKTLLVCLMPVGANALFRTAEAAVYCLMLYFNELTPLGLFSGSNPLQLIAALVFTVLRYIACTPLSYAAAVWLVRLCSESFTKDIRLSRVILSPDNFGRSFSAMLISKAVSLVCAAPVFIFGKITFDLIGKGIDGSESFRILLTVHAAVMTLVSAVMWLSVKLSLSSVFFLLASLPDKGAAFAVRYSFPFMKNRRGSLIRIFALRLFQMLPLVTIPFVLQRLYADIYLYFSICLREDHYNERIEIHCNKRKARYSSELSDRTDRHFPPSADKA